MTRNDAAALLRRPVLKILKVCAGALLAAPLLVVLVIAVFRGPHLLYVLMTGPLPTITAPASELWLGFGCYAVLIFGAIGLGAGPPLVKALKHWLMFKDAVSHGDMLVGEVTEIRRGTEPGRLPANWLRLHIELFGGQGRPLGTMAGYREDKVTPSPPINQNQRVTVFVHKGVNVAFWSDGFIGCQRTS